MLSTDPFLHYLLATQLAALACYSYIGEGDCRGADAAATAAMRQALNRAPFKTIVSIGEGERDQAPMLFRGEKLGAIAEEMSEEKGECFEIAVDPLEGTNLCANNQPNSICILMHALPGCILNAPDCYMEKLIVKSRDYCVDLDLSLSDNIERVAKAKNCDVQDVVVAMLKRDRHAKYYDEVVACGSKLYLFDDGDILMSLAVFKDLQLDYERESQRKISWPKIDMYYGIGGAPEGVIAAGMMKNLGGFMQGRLLDSEYSGEAKKMEIAEMVKGDCTVYLTGVTDGFLLGGVKKNTEGQTVYSTESLILRQEKKFQFISQTFGSDSIDSIIL